ncbi:hypothetical protein GMD58_08210 [Ruthenibacterium lactatiformans]|uniref:Uncharacterized protein n=1 Tax=Ruthenibacterium lactatiformans TaxID=1550024 RepID=A0A6I3QC82_9FIRM|nr:hypothetical protein [Ruthenibacterium lactatiformans]MTS18866.1 hypothetical protein [Ruthenibacterium lactatiformans]MTS34968.1 hypothetical protein [Ruthenibacterium lactatiformans]MTS48150.1 hypothetical protein [Ruthenibacterium lactatiformans]MTS51753.1 hypothetical protein [Ruthenibacterium lactatiformans]
MRGVEREVPETNYTSTGLFFFRGSRTCTASPAAIYGLLLLAALCLQVINPEQIKESTQWLITVMPILFMAPTVNLAEH